MAEPSGHRDRPSQERTDRRRRRHDPGVRIILAGGQQSLREFGFGLEFSVLVDAMIIRSLLVPAIMHIIGPANWFLPSWLSRALPDISVEVADPASSTDFEDRACAPELPASFF
jgi:hypothetical protein